MEETTRRKGMHTGAIIGIVILGATILCAFACLFDRNETIGNKQILETQPAPLQNQASSAETAATPDDGDAEWKTYTNTKHNYSFRHPDTATITATVGDLDNVAISSTADEVKVYPAKGSDVANLFYVGLSDTDFTVAAIKDRLSATDPGEVNITSTTIAGASSYKAMLSGNTLIASTFYFIKSPKGAVLELTVMNDNQDAQGILSSFQFEKDETASSIPIGWKTYSNSEYGFEISYPKGGIDANGALVVREKRAGDIDSFIVAFRQEISQDSLVTIEKYNQPKDFSDLLSVKKYYKHDGRFIVLEGWTDNPLADQIISTFRFIR